MLTLFVMLEFLSSRYPRDLNHIGFWKGNKSVLLYTLPVSMYLNTSNIGHMAILPHNQIPTLCTSSCGKTKWTISNGWVIPFCLQSNVVSCLAECPQVALVTGKQNTDLALPNSHLVEPQLHLIQQVWCTCGLVVMFIWQLMSLQTLPVQQRRPC